MLVSNAAKHLITPAGRDFLVCVEAKVGAELTRGLESLRQMIRVEALRVREVGDVDSCCAKRPGDGRRHQPLRATAEDRYGLAFDSSFHNRVNGIAKRIQKGSEPRRYHVASAELLEVHEIACGNDYVLGERAVQVHPLHPNVLADVTPASGALLAVSTKDMHFGSHVVADSGDTRMNVFADFHHLTAKLVADDDWLIARHVAAVVGEHLVAHSGFCGDLIDALVSPPDGRGRDPNLDFCVPNARLG